MVTDLEAAQRFYQRLFGWTYAPAAPGSTYHYAYLDGRLVGGLNPITGSYLAPDWNVYLATDNAAVTAFRVGQLGGTVLLGPSTVEDGGRFLIARDPAGALVAFRQAGALSGLERTDEPNTPTWYELWVRDAATADAFYAGLLGYDAGPTTPYRTYSRAGTQYAGRFRLAGPDIPAEVAARWVVYLATDSCEETFAAAVSAGAKPVREPDDSPHGRWAILRDPWGALFALLTRH